MDGRKLITVVIGGWVLVAVAHADMMPLVSPLDTVSRQLAHVDDTTEPRQRSSSSPFASLGVIDVNWRPIEFPPETSAGPGQIFDAQRPQSLTSGPSSLSLCLSAFIGLGLCSSAGYVKKLHFGIIPHWYHDGGPSQIGHSFAVNPDSVCPAPAYCFVQPAHTAENITPQYRRGTITSLWRKSQFTPETIAPRGPPMTC